MPFITPLDVSADKIGHMELAGFLGDAPFFVGITGSLFLFGENTTTHTLHDGLLAARLSKDGNFIITSGEDGRICRFDQNRELTTIHKANSGQWIDRLAIGPSGAIAFASGRKGAVLPGDGTLKPFESERTIEDICFAPKGMRLALARYNGAELLWVNTPGSPQFLEWKGAHILVCFSPDGKYVVTSMQENALHGWRITDGKHMQMTGYPAKVKSLDWSYKGKFLTSSGASAAIVWPFSGKDGPMGKAPKELGVMGNQLVTCVACHPGEDVIAIGYENGMVLAVRIEDGKEAVLRQGAQSNGAISTLGWDKKGTRLAYGSVHGQAGVIDIAE